MKWVIRFTAAWRGNGKLRRRVAAKVQQTAAVMHNPQIDIHVIIAQLRSFENDWLLIKQCAAVWQVAIRLNAPLRWRGERKSSRYAMA